MDHLAIFGVVSVTTMLVGHAFERRSHWATLVCAAGFAMTSAYAFLARVWIIGIVAFAGYLVEMNHWVALAEADGGAS